MEGKGFMIEEVLIYIIILITNIIQALTGFAGTLLAMPLAVRLIGIDSARIVLNFVGLVANAYLVCKGYKDINKKRIKEAIGWLISGMCIAYVMYKFIDSQILMYAYGVMIVVIALKKLIVKKELPPNEGVMKATLILAGIAQGLFASGGALLVIYLATKTEDKNEFRSTAAMIWVLLCSLFVFQNLNSITVYDMKLTICAMVPLFVGVTVGNKLHSKVSQERFLKIAYVLVLISGVTLFL